MSDVCNVIQALINVLKLVSYTALTKSNLSLNLLWKSYTVVDT